VADIYLTQFFHSRSTIGTPTAVTNFSHYTSIDNLLDEARVSSRPDEQKRMWQEAQRKILEDAVAYPLYISKFVYGRKNYVDYGYKLDSTLIYAPEVFENTRLLD
jgi:peptide/nickel transport system substrate-binding protein